MIRKILVPLDGSTFAEHALPVAADIAHRAHAELHLALVHEPLVPGVDGLASSRLSYPEEDLAYLNSVAARLSRSIGVEAATTLLKGEVAETLCEHVRAIHADLVVMTTHGRGPLSRLWFGAVADEMIRQSVVPVLLVRPADGTPDLARNSGIRNILIPLDGSREAEDILEPALELAKLVNAHVELMRVVEPVPVLAADPVGFPIAIDYDTGGIEAAEEYLQNQARPIREQKVDVQTRAVVHGHAATAVIEEAHGRRTDLIALSTHGRQGLTRLLLGSVADKIVRGANCSVLIHKAFNK